MLKAVQNSCDVFAKADTKLNGHAIKDGHSDVEIFAFLHKGTILKGKNLLLELWPALKERFTNPGNSYCFFF